MIATDKHNFFLTLINFKDVKIKQDMSKNKIKLNVNIS